MDRVKWLDKKFIFNVNQGEYKSILTELNETPGKAAALVNSLSEEVLTRRVKGKWSIKENIGHLSDLEELHCGRIDDFIERKEKLRSADLTNKKTYQASHNKKSIKTILSEFKDARKLFVKRMNGLDEIVVNRSSIHPRLNQPMRPIDMAKFVLEHDKHHLQTIKEMIEKLSS